MGLLSTTALSAIQSGAKIRQVWKIRVPHSLPLAEATIFSTYTIHDDDGDEKCVIDPGSISTSAYNVSFVEKGTLDAGSYAIEVDNYSGNFYSQHDWTVGQSYQNYFYADLGSSEVWRSPQECQLQHLMYVKTSSGWEEIYSYIGTIVDVEYTESAGPSGPVGATAIIDTESAAAAVLRYVFSAEDGDTVDTGEDVYLYTDRAFD